MIHIYSLNDFHQKWFDRYVFYKIDKSYLKLIIYQKSIQLQPQQLLVRRIIPQQQNHLHVNQTSQSDCL